jgi:hypothetical protein
MKKLVLLALVLELAVCGCGSHSTTNTTTSTSTTGNWEAQLIGGTQQASLLNFTVAFTVTNSGPLNITGFSFFNAGSCFANGLNGETENGTATFTTSSAGQVTGTLNLTVNSVTPAGNSLALTGNLTGTSSATTGTTGTLSNGVVVGQWTLTGGQGDSSCAGSGTFIMCQNLTNGVCPTPTT